MILLVWARECVLPWECRAPKRSHRIGGNRSTREAAHCANWGEVSKENGNSGAAYLDEGRTRSLHLLHQKAVPPNCTPSVASVAFSVGPNKQHGAGQDDGEEEDEEVGEAPGGENGFPDIVPEEGEDARGDVEVYFRRREDYGVELPVGNEARRRVDMAGYGFGTSRKGVEGGATRERDEQEPATAALLAEGAGLGEEDRITPEHERYVTSRDGFYRGVDGCLG